MSKPVKNSHFGEFLPGGSRPLMAMVEVTNRCNMSCPICFSHGGQADSDAAISSVRTSLLRLLEVTNTPVPLQISGGEPTLRDDLPEIIGMAKSLGYEHLELITNGLRIGCESGYLEQLKDKGLSAVYLQFDGLRPETTRIIRGQDMSGYRMRAVAALRRADICCTLAVAVTRGVNDDEMGEIIRFGIDNIDVVRAINFQAATRLGGRFDVAADYRGYSMRELLRLIEQQTVISRDTFISEHLGHGECNAMSPVFVVDGKVEPLFKHIERSDALRFLGADRREKILGTFAGKKKFFKKFLTSPESWKLIAQASAIFGANPYNVLKSRHILIFAKAFMEKEDLHRNRVEKCCYAVATESGVYSFCAYNNLIRAQQSKEGGL